MLLPHITALWQILSEAQGFLLATWLSPASGLTPDCSLEPGGGGVEIPLYSQHATQQSLAGGTECTSAIPLAYCDI
jgi:hypothetical protein